MYRWQLSGERQIQSDALNRVRQRRTAKDRLSKIAPYFQQLFSSENKVILAGLPLMPPKLISAVENAQISYSDDETNDVRNWVVKRQSTIMSMA
jgi:hypothetical protein